MRLIKKYKFTLIGALLGAIAGYAYYFFVGCNSGTCAITSNPINSTLYGVMLGGFLLNYLDNKTNNNKQ